MTTSIRWRYSIIFLSISVISILIFHFQEVTRTVNLWTLSGNYNHCFLILPIFAYMIWETRARVSALAPRPTAWGGPFLVLFSVTWLLSDVSGIAEGAQLSIVGLIQATVLTLLGWRIYFRLFIPFQMLWLLVPTGTVLIPFLQDVTAVGTEILLNNVTDIPTYREGLVIEVPSGLYLVAPSCAGLNFLLAALTVSLAYAELTYRSWGRRLVFIAALVTLAVVGNVFRVFLIITIAHMTNNVGDIVGDHLIYGWGFFSLVMLAAMWFGQRFQETTPPTAPARSSAATGSRPRAEDGNRGPMMIATTLVLLVIIAVPTAAEALRPPDAGMAVAAPNLDCADGWRRGDSADAPAIKADQADATAVIACTDGRRGLFAIVALLERPLKDGKLLGLERRLIDRSAWHRLGQRVGSLSMEGTSAPVLQETFDIGNRRLLVWSLRWAGGGWRGTLWDTALADLRAELAGQRRAGLILVAAESFGETDDAAAAERIRAFLRHLSPQALIGG